MAAVRNYVKTVMVDYFCDECNTGKMRPTGMTLTSMPAQYPHECTSCQARKTFLCTYPTIEYEKA